MNNNVQRKKCILLADDEQDELALLEMRLKTAGYNVVKAVSGDEALAMIGELSPDLIVMDIFMPGMDGFSVKNKLNEDNISANIPVIFLTGYDDIKYKMQGFKSGIDDYITKPFDGKELLLRVDAVLKRKEFYEKISMTDSLTGLYNLHYLKSHFEHLFKSAKRYKQKFSIAIVDIDDFKAINDEFGHAVGDLVIKEIAYCLKWAIRESDIVTRYGGDEFVIVFPSTEKEEAFKAMERIKGEVNGKYVHFDTRKIELALSISSGVAEYDESMLTPEDMFAAADKFMFEDKKNNKR